MKMSDEVMQLLNSKESLKVLTTISADGIPHSIAVGSMTAPDSETLCVAEIFMKSTKNNLAANENVAVLTVKGSEAYLINATVIKRQVEGDLFDKISEQMKKANLPMNALWLFQPTAVFDQSPGPNAGKKHS